MPTHTVPSALIKLYHAEPGAPWSYPAWKELTGVFYGIFPPDDSKLPAGWTRQHTEEIASYFDQYQNKKTEEERIKFAAQRKTIEKETVPGRARWRQWVNSNVAAWKIQHRITEVLRQLNVTPLQLMVANQVEKAPDSTSYLPATLDQIGLSLFGEEALDKSGLLKARLREGTLILAQRTWENLKKQVARSRARLESLEEAALSAFNELDHEKLTKAKIAAVIRSVGRWKNLAEQHDVEEMLERIEKLEEELKGLMEGLGVEVKGKKSNQRASSITPQALHALASREDVSELANLYDEFFSTPSEIPVDSICTVDAVFGNPVEGADPGVDVEYKMSGEILVQNLDFRHYNLPVLFNSVRHTVGLTPWDPKHQELFLNANLDGLAPGLEPVSLHWHQLAGVHAVIRKSFSSDADASHCTGVLLADEVGIGKTIQSLAVIAFLTDLGVRQERKLPLPPIINKFPYLSNHAQVPNLPHLIIVPGTLLAQWEQEVKILFRPASVDILLYGRGDVQHAHFWSEHGPYLSSNHEPRNRIIIASHSALLQDFQRVYQTQLATGRTLPWDPPKELPGSAKTRPETLFGHQYLTVVFDEAQGVRNPGPKHSSALAVLKQSVVRLILTATPLQTSTKDIGAMGRLVGLPYFSSNAAYHQQLQDAADLRRARQEKAEDPSLTGERDPVRLSQIQTSHRLQSRFDGRVIRRTPASLNPEGKPLIDLPPLTIIYAILKLTPRELSIIDDVTKDDLNDAAVTNTKSVTSSTFYLAHRKGVTFAREAPDSPLPTFKTLDEWEPVKSTKIDTCARLCQYILQRDDAPPVMFENGEAIFPSIPSPEPGVTPSRTTKVIIYQEFPYFRPVLVNILKLHGVDCVWIDGRTSFEKRAETVTKFKVDPTCRVLLFSKVGTVGLNLSCANVVVFLDQPWSFQDEIQIRGRAHRQPQNRPVTCYHLLGADTADIVLSSMARGKRDMLDAFLSTETAKKLLVVLNGESIDDSEEGEEEETNAVVKLKSKKGRTQHEPGRKQKAAKEKAIEIEVVEKEADLALTSTHEGCKPSSTVRDDNSSAAVPPTTTPGSSNEDTESVAKDKATATATADHTAKRPEMPVDKTAATSLTGDFAEVAETPVSKTAGAVKTMSSAKSTATRKGKSAATPTANDSAKSTEAFKGKTIATAMPGDSAKTAKMLKGKAAIKAKGKVAVASRVNNSGSSGETSTGKCTATGTADGSSRSAATDVAGTSSKSVAVIEDDGVMEEPQVDIEDPLLLDDSPMLIDDTPVTSDGGSYPPTTDDEAPQAPLALVDYPSSPLCQSPPQTPRTESRKRPLPQGSPLEEDEAWTPSQRSIPQQPAPKPSSQASELAVRSSRRPSQSNDKEPKKKKQKELPTIDLTAEVGQGSTLRPVLLDQGITQRKTASIPAYRLPSDFEPAIPPARRPKVPNPFVRKPAAPRK